MNGSFNILIALAIIGIASLSACKENVIVPARQDKSYYPFTEGDQRVYHVDSLVYNDFTMTIDTFTFKIREVVQKVNQDEQGRENVLVYASLFRDSIWLPYRSIEFVFLEAALERKQENEITAVLGFPMAEDQFWFGNLRSSRNTDWLFSYDYFDEPITIDSLQYLNAARVKQDSTRNLIQDIYSYEVYAKDVGMVLSYSKNLETQFGEVSGDIVSKKLIQFIPGG